MIRNKVNNKAYIGQAIDIYARWEQHIRELNNNLKYCNPHLQNAWNKYGADNFEFTIICQCLEYDLDRLEIHYIAHYDTYNNGYNLSLGGEGNRGYKFTDEQRAKVGEVLNRPEVKKKHRERTREAVNRPEVKEKHRKAMNRPEVKAKVSESLKEAWKRPEVKAKRIESRKGKPSHNRKAVYCVTNDTVYASGKEAGEKLGIGLGTVSWCCQGKYTSGNGHVCKKLGLEFWFLSEYEEKFGKVAI